MPKDTLVANAATMPIDRPAALGAIAVGALFDAPRATKAFGLGAI